MSSEEASQTRRELLQTIESQRESIGKYERRLRDVVRAYKGLAKEKEALEETLRAISGKGEEDDDKREAEREGEGATTDKGSYCRNQTFSFLGDMYLYMGKLLQLRRILPMTTPVRRPAEVTPEEEEEEGEEERGALPRPKYGL